MKSEFTPVPDKADGLRRLRHHERDCEQCQAGDGFDAEAIVALLSSEAFEMDTNALVASMHVAARCELVRLEARRLRRRTYLRAALAALPLPVVLVYAAAMVHALSVPVATVLGAGAADYFVAVHFGLLTLLLGATYAAIPLSLGRSVGRATDLAHENA